MGSKIEKFDGKNSGESLFQAFQGDWMLESASRKTLGHPPIVSVRTSNLGQA